MPSPGSSESAWVSATCSLQAGSVPSEGSKNFNAANRLCRASSASCTVARALLPRTPPTIQREAIRVPGGISGRTTARAYSAWRAPSRVIAIQAIHAAELGEGEGPDADDQAGPDAAEDGGAHGTEPLRREA